MVYSASRTDDHGAMAPVLSSTSTTTSQAERESLLQPSRQRTTSSSKSCVEDQADGGTSADTLTLIQRVFSAKVLGIMFGFFMSGLCSTGVGALISGIESFYHITDGPTAFIFPTGMVGYIFATMFLQKTIAKYGWRGVALLSPSLRLLSCIIISTGLPFPVILAGYFVHGFGIGIADSGFCAWGSKVPLANIVQGMMHASFSSGAISGPILALALARQGFQWYVFYRVMAILSCFEIVALGTAFRRDNAIRSAELPSDDTQVVAKHPLRMVAVWTCGIFYFFYVGIEASFSDWTIEFMKRVRHMDPTLASLSSSIFWIGMTLGRVSLGHVTERFGLGRCVSSYIALSTLFQICFKLTSDATTSLVFLGANGFFLGPMFPSAIILLAKKVPAQNKIGAVAAAAAMGQLGGASAPLAVGLLADSFGIGRMLDVILGLSFVLLAIWFAFCRLRLAPRAAAVTCA